jgi:hypothetical protein
VAVVCDPNSQKLLHKRFNVLETLLSVDENLKQMRAQLTWKGKIYENARFSFVGIARIFSSNNLEKGA